MDCAIVGPQVISSPWMCVLCDVQSENLHRTQHTVFSKTDMKCICWLIKDFNVLRLLNF